jgi:hypothetical protein
MMNAANLLLEVYLCFICTFYTHHLQVGTNFIPALFLMCVLLGKKLWQLRRRKSRKECVEDENLDSRFEKIAFTVCL